MRLYYTLIPPLPCPKEMRQAEHRAGRKLVCKALRCREDDIRVHDNGKPYLPGGPHFSLSHSGGMVLLAVCDENPIGCDVEPTDRVVRNEEAIRRKIAQPGDEALPFLQLWVKHEAVLKSGLGGDAQVCYPEMPDGWIAAVASLIPVPYSLTPERKPI